MKIDSDSKQLTEVARKLRHELQKRGWLEEEWNGSPVVALHALFRVILTAVAG